jgi:drug/metabolite transporter (DMT)-like permease
MPARASLFRPLAVAFDRLPGAVRAAAWTVLGSTCIVVFSAIAKGLSGELPITMIVFFRSSFGLALLLPWLMRVGIAGATARRPGLLLARGCNTLAGLYTMFWAVKLIPIADVMAIMFSKPVFAAAVAVLVLGEVMYRTRWIAMALALGGMVVIVRPGFAEIDAGVLLALATMLIDVFATISLRLLARTEPPDRIVAWTLAIVTAGSAVPAFLSWQTPTPTQFLWLAAIAVFANGFQRCMARAFAAADATVVMPFEFSRLIVAAIVGFLVFGELSDVWVWSGGAIVFAAAVYMVRAESRRERGA